MASCRSCGGDLDQIAQCPACEESIQWRCGSCSKETDVSIHTHDGRVFGPADVTQTAFAAAA